MTNANAKERTSGGRAERTPKTPTWQLKLYVAGQSPKSVAAYSNLKRLCESHLKDDYHIEVVDLLERPHLARADEIVAIPTLVRKVPEPLRRIIGDLSNEERALVGLDLL